jgi:hypothetical protein
MVEEFAKYVNVPIDGLNMREQRKEFVNPANRVVPLAQSNSVSCGQTSVAAVLTARTGTQWNDQEVNAKYGFGLLLALQGEDKAGGWHDAGNLSNESIWANKVKPILKAGWPVIVGLNGKFSVTGRGHIITLLSVDPNGVVTYADPNANEWGDTKGYRKTTVAEILACETYPGGKFIFCPTLPKQ